MRAPEKPTHPTVDPESPVSPISDNATRDQAPAHNGPDSGSWSAMPKRKPLPTPAVETAIAADATKTAPAPGAKSPSKFGTWLIHLDWYRYASRRKKRNFFIIAAIGITCLLALIVGLAVGLSLRKKNSTQKFALPTSNGGPYSGDLTYYNPALGSCGYTNTDSDFICAVSHVLFDAASTGSNPNENPLCGMKLRLRRDGRSVDVKVVDRCVGCKETDLDVTEAVFEKVAEIDLGRVGVEWAWLEAAPVSVS
ncbi:hypothetical protein N7532_011308 [Penicillium argentinense]|uniref:RlpA-like protein double-psi beta-barrel domain-containing protein n=1 Tax=Penicillium argentinense TaxID=1131581 RepID=A0A9W9EIB0_9EURO|nr:uncharacterized protein N7532_011308 [Penicillium argentinense]KAJ5082265.1 hypothetical protein N7532_011308 [Penicillium argentinense]